MEIQKYIRKIKEFVPGEMTKQEQSYVLNSFEALLYKVSELQEEVQLLKDQVNRLQGEQGKPDIKGNTGQKDETTKEADLPKEDSSSGDTENTEPTSKDISSEKERKPKGTNKGKKGVKFDGSRQADKEDVIPIDKGVLPSDALFKGYAVSRYYDLQIQSSLIEVKREVYYSPSEGKNYTAPLRPRYDAGSDYTNELKGHVVALKYKFGMSIPKIEEWLNLNGVPITKGTISNILLEKGASSQVEYEQIHELGLQIGLFNQSDTTGARVNGQNQHCHVFGNAYYTAYFTTPHKDRQTIIDLVRSNRPRAYLLNDQTLAIYKYLKIPKKVVKLLAEELCEKSVDQKSFTALLQEILPRQDYERQIDKLLEGAYLAHYHSEDPLRILVADDAPQYKLTALLIALCWVHAGRHFKKLNPKITYHQELLDKFLTDFWQYYHRLLVYKQAPDPLIARQLSSDFDHLFSQQSGFDLLDERIAKTKAKKRELLVVLEHPYIPLHNNASELDARKEVEYRNISFQTRNQKGTLAKDVFFTIVQTCKKLGVNAYAYILDIVSNKREMTPLTDIMIQKAMTF